MDPPVEPPELVVVPPVVLVVVEVDPDGYVVGEVDPADGVTVPVELGPGIPTCCSNGSLRENTLFHTEDALPGLSDDWLDELEELEDGDTLVVVVSDLVLVSICVFSLVEGDGTSSSPQETASPVDTITNTSATIAASNGELFA